MPSGDNTRKLSNDQINYIKERIIKGICMAALARKFKVSRQRIWQYKKARKQVTMLSDCKPSSSIIAEVGFID